MPHRTLISRTLPVQKYETNPSRPLLSAEATEPDPRLVEPRPPFQRAQEIAKRTQASDPGTPQISLRSSETGRTTASRSTRAKNCETNPRPAALEIGPRNLQSWSTPCDFSRPYPPRSPPAPPPAARSARDTASRKRNSSPPGSRTPPNSARRRARRRFRFPDPAASSAPSFDRHLDQLADAFLIDHRERIGLEDLQLLVVLLRTSYSRRATGPSWSASDRWCRS